MLLIFGITRRYVWGALGLWPLPCGGRFYLGSPTLQHVVLNAPDESGLVRSFEFTAADWSPNGTRVQRILIDGNPVFDAAAPVPGALIVDAAALVAGSHRIAFEMAV